MSSTTKPTASFLTLPAEIRNQIYTSLFISDTPRIKRSYTLSGLLTSCRQVHKEAIELYYSSTPFRCLDETSTISWLCSLPSQYLDLIPEVRYDTRWIIFVTPYIPVPGVEVWLLQNLLKKLEERAFDVERLIGEGGEKAMGKLKISFYEKGAEGGVAWTNKPGLVECVQGAE